MAGSPSDGASEPDYAVRLAEASFAWYRKAAIRARRAFRLAETIVLFVSAAIPVSAVIAPDDATVPAILGGVIVVVSGMRVNFHWQDNYLRFSGSREAVNAEVRRYRTGAGAYADPATRDQVLVEAITRIEQDELAGWTKVAAQRPKD